MTQGQPTHAPYKRQSKGAVAVLLVLGLVPIALGYMIVIAFLFPQIVPPQLAHLVPQPHQSAQSAKVDAKSGKAKKDKPSTDDQQKEQDTMNSTLSQLFSTGSVHSVRLVGDSITAGFLTDGYADGDLTQTGAVVYDDGAGDVHFESGHDAVCWANAFRSYAAEHGVSDFVNAGINGAFMDRLSQNPSAWLGNGADVVFVALGTNDAGYYGTEEFRANAAKGLAAAADASKVLVVVSPVSDLRPQSNLVVPPWQLGEVLRQICEENGYVFVDASRAVAPDQFNVDGLHPNSEGSLAIWQCVRDSLGLMD